MTRYKLQVWSDRQHRWKTAYAKDAESFYRNLSRFAECGLTVKGRILE